MDRRQWHTSYLAFPTLPCPRCKNLSLQYDRKSRRVVEPKHDKSWRGDPQHSIYEWVGRFDCFLVCSYSSCGEIVSVSGEVDYQEDLSDDEHVSIDEYLRPKSMWPAPPIIPVSRKLNQECAGHLKQAFGLLWVDTAASVNRIRIFVEHLMDSFEVPRNKRDANGNDLLDKNGFPQRFTLGERIKMLEAKKPGHKETFDALRDVGNIASHEGAIRFETVLDAFEILESALEDLVDGKRERKETLIKKLSGDRKKL